MPTNPRTIVTLLLAGVLLLGCGITIAALLPYPTGMLGSALTMPGGLLVGSMSYQLYLQRHRDD